MDYQHGQIVFANIKDDEWHIGMFCGFKTDDDGNVCAEVACGTEGNFLVKRIKPIEEAYCMATLDYPIQSRYRPVDKFWYINKQGKLHRAMVDRVQPASYRYRLFVLDNDTVDVMDEADLIAAVDAAQILYRDKIEAIEEMEANI